MTGASNPYTNVGLSYYSERSGIDGNSFDLETRISVLERNFSQIQRGLDNIGITVQDNISYTIPHIFDRLTAVEDFAINIDRELMQINVDLHTLINNTIMRCIWELEQRVINCEEMNNYEYPYPSTIPPPPK